MNNQLAVHQMPFKYNRNNVSNRLISFNRIFSKYYDNHDGNSGIRKVRKKQNSQCGYFSNGCGIQLAVSTALYYWSFEQLFRVTTSETNKDNHHEVYNFVFRARSILQFIMYFMMIKEQRPCICCLQTI